MISTSINKDPEVAIIQANSSSVDGWNLHWLISRTQIEYILHDIAAVPAGKNANHIQRAQYQEEVLPVFSLERYYALDELPVTKPFTYMVTKLPLSTGGLTKAILRISNPVRIRKLNFNATQAQQTGLQANVKDIFGAFTLPENQLVVVPDIAAILKRELHPTTH